MRRALALILLGAVLVACTTGPATDADPTSTPGRSTVSPGDAGGTLRWALAADPTSLDPSRIVTREDELVIDALFDSLTRLGPTLAVEAALAVAWSSDEDATTWTFELDPAARWSDGSPVVAADVVRGLNRVADGTAVRPSLHAELLESVQGYATPRGSEPLSGIRALDDHTVEFVLSSPEPDLPAIVAHPALAPVPQAAVDEPIAFAEGPVGNGPFRLAEPWSHNQFLRLEASPTHPSPPLLGELVFRIYAGDARGEVRWADLLAGQVQVAAAPLARRDEVAPTFGLGALHDDVLDVTTVLLVASDQPVTDDVRVRRAISLFVDREGIAARTNGARVAATGLVPPTLPHASATTCRWCRHDPVGASVLLEAAVVDAEEARAAAATVDVDVDVGTVDGADEAGGPGGDDADVVDVGTVTGEGPAAGDADDATGEDRAGTEAGPDGSATAEPSTDATEGAPAAPAPSEDRPRLLVLAPDDGVSTAIAQQVRDGLRSQGVDARFESVPPAALPDAIDESEPAVVVLQWAAAVPRVESFVTELFGPRSIGRDITGWRSPVVTELLQAISSSTSIDERVRRATDLEELALDEAIVIPLLHATGELTVVPSVRGFTQAADGSVDLTVLEVVTAP